MSHFPSLPAGGRPPRRAPAGPAASLSPLLRGDVAGPGPLTPREGPGTQSPAHGCGSSTVAVSGVQAPAGRVTGEGARSAGFHLRTFTIELPPGMQLLSLNGRLHWRERHARNEMIKGATIVMARQAKIPPLDRVTITAEFQPPDRRRRDPDNVAVAAKAAIDGVVAAGILAGDDSRFVASVTCVIGEPYPQGRLVLHVTEVAA